MAAARLRTLERYFARQIYGNVLFVLAAFLGLFAFFDLINELEDIGKGGYRIQHALGFVALTLPGHAYELFPIVVLIGTLYVLAQLASNSEYTVMRASGLSPRRAGITLTKIGLAFVVLTFLIGEWVAPWSEEQAQKVKMRAMSGAVGQDAQGRDVIVQSVVKGQEDPDAYRAYIAEHELKGADVWAWDSEEHYLRYREERKHTQRAALRANAALALAIGPLLGGSQAAQIGVDVESVMRL